MGISIISICRPVLGGTMAMLVIPMLVCSNTWAAAAQSDRLASKPSSSAVAAKPTTLKPTGRKSAEPGVVKRKILALYDGSRIKETADTPIHKRAEMPLNHLGYDVRYWDINKALPNLSDLADYRGILTWFGAPLKRETAYLSWAERAAASGLKFVVFDHVGARVNKQTQFLFDRFLAHIGLRFNNAYISQTLGSEIVQLNSDFIGFERSMYKVIPPYNLYQQIDPALKTHLVLRTPLHQGGKQAVLAAHGSGGGFVQSGFATIYEKQTDRIRWLLNPFAFFRAAFGAEEFPVPDTTTLSGRRIYFSHVDGDGWLNVSYIEHYLKNKTLSSQVMLNELIRPYPDLPVTVALVTGDFDEAIGGDATAGAIAREMFALPQVEVGSHTHTHPFNWGFYEHYNRDKELALVERQSANASSTNGDNGLVDKLSGLVGKPTSPRERNKKYIAGSDEAPRAYMRNLYDMDHDILSSLKLAESYAPPGKKAKLLQWSGDTRPFKSALAALRQAGIANLNGGDPRFDMEFPSTFYLSPLSRMVGEERQVYAAASNENTYTNNWTGPYYGFGALTQTLKNTEFPRRLKPFNVYYHTYSAERQASLKAVKKHLEAARVGPYTPIPASQYAAIVDSFFDVKIVKSGPRKWTIKNRDQLQTMRFDLAQNITVDWSKSSGILGARRHAGALYLALDATVKEPVIAIRSTSARQRTKRSQGPRLQDSRWQIKQLKLAPCHTQFVAQGFGKGEMVWTNVTPGQYIVEAKLGAKILWHEIAKVGADKRLQLALSESAFEPLHVRFTCQKSLQRSARNRGR